MLPLFSERLNLARVDRHLNQNRSEHLGITLGTVFRENNLS
jgi:hypothetical protein